MVGVGCEGCVLLGRGVSRQGKVPCILWLHLIVGLVNRGMCLVMFVEL